MTYRLFLRRAAIRDMAETREWYDLQQDGVGKEFADEAEALLARIRDNPQSYAAGRSRARQAIVNRFPYVVVYRIVEQVVEVLAVVHTSRHPRSWRSRL